MPSMQFKGKAAQAVFDALTKPRQCMAKGCVNTSDKGEFVGHFCAPCDNALVVGEAKFGTSVIFQWAKRIKTMEEGLRLIVAGTICPELFPNETNEDVLACKTAMTIALALLEPSEFVKEVGK
jgi:hypothetical protein